MVLLIVAFTIVATILLWCQWMLLRRTRKGEQDLHKERRKVGLIAKRLYGEYQRVRGSDWATNAIKDVIHDVVNNDAESTRIRRA